MSEAAKEVETAAPAAEVKKNPKPKAKKVAKATRPKSSHPTTAVMVQNALTELKERSGSSLQAIKKYIASTYKVDSEKMAPFIKKFLKSSVASGALVQTKGKGASGSFKLATAAVSKKGSAKPKKPVAAKSAKEAKPKTAKKAAAKPKAKPAKPVEKKPKATKAKSPKKTPVKSVAKSTKKAKSPARKSKAPKPKTTKSVGKKK